MEQLKHFSHGHMLSLVPLQPDHKNENSDKEDEDDDEDDIVVENSHVGKCKMCEEEIYPFHLCYYSCKDCDYSLHKFCAQLPITQQNHPLHPGHNLTLSQGFQLRDPDVKINFTYDGAWMCFICSIVRKSFYNYHCSICKFSVDIICATMYKQHIDHQSHPHQLQRCFTQMISRCYACEVGHAGTFYVCTSCSGFQIHLDCALLPAKLLIQQFTNESFSHPHLLTLAYSFPYIELKAKFFPRCRVCGIGLYSHKWHYRCNKCQYYVHLDCATSRRKTFMPPGRGRIFKIFKDADHPNLIRCPFPDENVNLLTLQFIKKGDSLIKEKIDGERFSHQHPLILFYTLVDGSISFHDPMKKVQLLCDGCVRPITNVPFYKCSEHPCGFVLHEWCTRLPSEIQGHHDHPEHTLVLLPKVPRKYLGLFVCKICRQPSNGFAYGCMQCEYYVDINCAFIPNLITHDSHPNHLLLRFRGSTNTLRKYCMACQISDEDELGFHCPTCNIYIHAPCALLLPGTIRHKCDKHPLTLRYVPAENHVSEYFCEICEEEFNPAKWFYHCSMCAISMHTACAPIKLQYERSALYKNSYMYPVFMFLNVKCGGTYEISDHLHHVTLVQGIYYDGQCIVCDNRLQDDLIFKCFQCKFARHLRCVLMEP